MRRPQDTIYGVYLGITIYRDLHKPEYYALVNGEEIVESNIDKIKARIDWRVKRREVKK